MTVNEITAEAYGQFMHDCPMGLGHHIFNSLPFLRLNEYKLKEKGGTLIFIGLRDETTRGGKPGKLLSVIALGDDGNGNLLSPFSAPYGGWVISPSHSQQTFGGAASSLKKYVERNAKSLKLIFPPQAYAPEAAAKTIFAFSQERFSPSLIPSYHIPVSGPAEDYAASLFRNSRQKLKEALHNDLSLIEVPPCELPRVFSVIERNHKEHGYNLSMSMEDVAGTLSIAKGKLFVVTHPGMGDVAAGWFIETAPRIWQLIHWGSLTEANSLRPMNFFAYAIYKYFQQLPIPPKMIDFGPALEGEGKPNYPLIQFKESIGGILSLKYSFTFQPR